jgi:hypothetical protein
MDYRQNICPVYLPGARNTMGAYGRYVAVEKIAMRSNPYDTACDLLIRCEMLQGENVITYKLKQKQYLNTHGSVSTMQYKSFAVLSAINYLSCI